MVPAGPPAPSERPPRRFQSPEIRYVEPSRQRDCRAVFGQFSLSPWHIRKEQSTDVVQTLLDKPLNFLKSRVEARSVSGE
jgi:hypothetical protein